MQPEPEPESGQDVSPSVRCRCKPALAMTCSLWTADPQGTPAALAMSSCQISAASACWRLPIAQLLPAPCKQTRAAAPKPPKSLGSASRELQSCCVPAHMLLITTVDVLRAPWAMPTYDELWSVLL